MFQPILSLIVKIIQFFIYRFSRLDDSMIIFIPHGGCMADGYGLSNFKSDNALSFLHYLIESQGDSYKYRIAVDYRELEKKDSEAKTAYPDLDIECFPFFNIPAKRDIYFISLFRNSFCYFSRAKFFFASEQIDLPFKKSKQIVVFLGYFIPFKNDYNVAWTPHNQSVAQTCDYYITTSLLSSQIISHSHAIPLCKFHALGFSRNDFLKQIDTKNHVIRDLVCKNVSYKVDHIFLYTPTHRDYEKDNSNNVTRSIFGINIDNEELECFLELSRSLIICKLHSAQVRDVIDESLPNGVVIFRGTGEYGLCELMQISDCLITDYTSAYFDYLLLDKPVLFNFYDFEKYKQYRGFSFDPLESILAGYKYDDVDSFIHCMKRVINNEDEWKTKRTFVKELVHKYEDSLSSQRIFNKIILGKND